MALYDACAVTRGRQHYKVTTYPDKLHKPHGGHAGAGVRDRGGDILGCISLARLDAYVLKHSRPSSHVLKAERVER